MKEILIGAFIAIIAVAVAYGGWVIKKNVSYSLEYEAMVIKTVKAEIKPLELKIKTLEDEVKLLKQGK